MNEDEMAIQVMARNIMDNQDRMSSLFKQDKVIVADNSQVVKDTSDKLSKNVNDIIKQSEESPELKALDDFLDSLE